MNRGKGDSASAEEEPGGHRPLSAPWWLSLLVIPVVVAFATSGLNDWWQQRRDDRQKNSEAENTAQALERNLFSAQDALHRSYLDGRYRLYDLEVNLPLDDAKLLAGELSGTGYEQVAAAASAYSLEVARAREEHPFVQDDRVQLACAMEAVTRGRRALNGFTDAPERGVQRDLRESRRACRGETVRDYAQLFYDNFVDGNGTIACRNVYGAARQMMRAESPNCLEDVTRPEHPSGLHPYARAIFNGARVDGGSETVSVHLQAATGGSVGTLVMTDRDQDNVWHIERIRHLKAVSLPRVHPKGADSKKP